jgi:hypothetical protein
LPGKSPKEAVENFAGFICETLSCITSDPPQAYQESENLYKILFKKPARVTAKNGDPFYIQVTQTFTVKETVDGTFKVHTREYSYVFSSSSVPAHKGILSYHWHPEDFDLHDPHLHITITPNMGYPEIERRISRAHFPTSRICLEDFLLLLIKYYDIKPVLHSSTWKRILGKNKAAFSQQASWFVKPAL